MLQNFFALNAPTVRFTAINDFLDHFRNSNDLRNTILDLQPLQLPAQQSTLRNKTFVNVSFSKKEIIGLRFLNCKFEDCLFIGSKFTDCEFHDCEFIYCNTHKIEFKDTYINPKFFEKMMDRNISTHRRLHVNIGLHLFQRLLKNSREMQQAAFFETADFNYRLWSRYQLTRRWRGDLPSGKLKYFRPNSLQFYAKWLLNLIDQCGRGYGWRLGRFFLTSSAALGLLVVVNYNVWKFLEFRNGSLATSTTFDAAFYNTVVIVTTLGLGDINPGTSLGLYVIAAQALFGPIWLSLLASILIKRMIR